MLDIFKYLNISKNEIKAKYKSIITLEQKEYDRQELIETSNNYIIPGIIDIYIPEMENFCHIFLNYNIKLNKPKNINEEGTIIVLTYEPDDLIIFQDFIDTNINMKLIIDLLEGRIKYIKDPLILLYSLYDQLSGVDMIHLELIISNMFRCKDDLNKKCRSSGNYKNGTILGQWEQPFNDSWLSSLAFERVDKAIHSGLVKEKTIQNNPMELLINERFDEL